MPPSPSRSRTRRSNRAARTTSARRVSTRSRGDGTGVVHGVAERGCSRAPAVAPSGHGEAARPGRRWRHDRPDRRRASLPVAPDPCGPDRRGPDLPLPTTARSRSGAARSATSHRSPHAVADPPRAAARREIEMIDQRGANGTTLRGARLPANQPVEISPTRVPPASRARGAGTGGPGAATRRVRGRRALVEARPRRCSSIRRCAGSTTSRRGSRAARSAC